MAERREEEGEKQERRTEKLSRANCSLLSEACVFDLNCSISLNSPLLSPPTPPSQPPQQERVTFAPHPKTMTMAGDYEYYAAQGRQPLAFAVAELVDNALRATAGSMAASLEQASTSSSSQTSLPPRIEVTVALDSDKNPTAGLVSVWDNGAGMSKAALNAWAVMNLAVSERADEGGSGGGRGGDANENRNDDDDGVSLSPALAAAPDALASARHLNGDLSYFGVGSKNAAFFLGRRVGVATSRRGEGVVRELALDAAALEARYQAAAAAASTGGREEAVYADDLVHRDPGDPSTLVEAAPAAGGPVAPSAPSAALFGGQTWRGVARPGGAVSGTLWHGEAGRGKG